MPKAGSSRLAHGTQSYRGQPTFPYEKGREMADNSILITGSLIEDAELQFGRVSGRTTPTAGPAAT